MKIVFSKAVLLSILLVVLMAPDALLAASSANYCINPAFITAGVKPNLLMLIDNSASMFDLAYVDKGKKHCSTTTATGCFYDSDCPSGETCSVYDRQPYYCFDQTYSSSGKYYGYFDKDKFYYYRSGTDDFAETVSAFPSGCGSVAVGSTTKTIANTMCIEYLGSAVKSFVAKGNYLNWLTASKLDIQKKILTGGVYDGVSLIPESRGCVGRGYIKQANTTDFVNFSGSPANDTNQSLGITFTVTGPANTNSATAPSTGGQTYINLYAGSTYNYADCQAAIDAIASGGNATIKQTVDACLNSSGTTAGYCQQNTSQSCNTSPECLLNSAQSSSVKVCKDGTNLTCTTDANCSIDARNSCHLDTSISCTGPADTTSCRVTTAEVQGTCGTWAPALANGSQPPTKCDLGTYASTTVYNRTGDGKYECKYKKSNESSYHYASCSYTPASTTDKGPCDFTGALSYGACTNNYTGPCVLPASAVATKSKVAFQQSLQACWALRNNGTAIGNDDILTVINQCSDVYGSFATCSNNHQQTCDPTVANSCGAGNTCQTGPFAISAGSHALLCGSEYEGQFYELSGSAWVLKPGYDKTSQAMKDVHTQFCNEMTRPNVTDPTDAPSNTSTTDNLPAILSGIGVEAQLGAPKATMRARVAVSTPACSVSSDCATGNSCESGVCKPSGLVQQFSSLIRIGAMSFNPFGSASETALTGTPKTCPSGTTCTQDVDCGGAAGSCAPATAGTTNLDGGRVIYPIGWGYCATMTPTQCVSDADCSGFNTCQNTGYCGIKSSTRCATVLTCSGSNQACITDSAGDHTTANTLIKTIDDVKASTWTPLSEAIYNAIGYFAAVPQADGTFKSRVSGSNATGMRLNNLNSGSTDYSSFSVAPVDFNENFNPSENRCQQNYVLLITDGSSTADRNSAVNAMAGLYASSAGITQTTCTGAPTGSTIDYGGNNNLPIMTWIAKNRRIYDVNVSGTASTATASNARDSISTYVVFNGESNGASGDCNSLTLLDKAAVKGGTTLKQANDYPGLVTALTSVFNDVSAKAASGTAASILSNSEGSGANILQAVFYPKKIFEDTTAANWIGEMLNMWYFVDPYINNSTIREDTDGDNKLNLISDNVARFTFDNSADRTMVQLYRDTDGDGLGDLAVGSLIDPDDVKALWRAGRLLWKRDISAAPRKIYTPLLTGGTEIAGTGLMTFTYGNIGTTTFDDNSAVLQPYLQYPVAVAGNNAEAVKLIKWVHGFDLPVGSPPVYSLRNRTVKIGSIPDSVTNSANYLANSRDKGIGVWKLGDIISSTPRVQSTIRLNTYDLPRPGGYSDKSYESYVKSAEYANRGMVYVGSNDGMLHAFNLGILSVKASGFQKATLSDPDSIGFGKEMWAFLPKNYLPYLRYLAEPAAKHLYAVDGRTSVFDASIGDNDTGSCVKSTYWLCDKPTSGSGAAVVDSSNHLVSSKNTWRSIVIGGMGLGGASRSSCLGDVACVETPQADMGYSSYFALDVTDPVNPKFLWEFSNNQLGYSTTGPAIVRVGPPDKNGRWFAVFGNGPFGDIKNQQFRGKSDHHLRFFIVDLRTGDLVKTVTTLTDNGFAGAMLGASIDADRWDYAAVGAYQDDAIYVGYTKQVGTGASATWTDGGVGRLMIPPVAAGAQPDAAWVTSAFNWSTVIDGIGPVTTAISRLQDRKNKNLWLFFGTGRYFFRDSVGLDDRDTRRTLYGIKEPCYLSSNHLDNTCTTSISGSVVDQTDSITTTLSSANTGWKIDLDDSTTAEGAERVVTDTVALINGTVFFTSFKPTMDICGYGGNSFLWGVKYDTGGMAASNTLKGKALIQLSTGEFKEVDLSTAFTDKLNRRMATPMTGKPPSDAPPIVSSSQNKPVKRILHLQER